MSEEASTPKKPNILLRLLALLVTAALIFGALALVVYRDQLNIDALRRWLNYRSLETSQLGTAVPFSHAGGGRFSMACLDRGVVLASKNGAHYYSFEGEQFSEEILPLQNPVLASGNNVAVVYDVGGTELRLFRNWETAFSLTLPTGNILLSARVNDTGWLAVTAQESGYKGAVTVYDSDYEKVIQVSLSSTFVIDAAISPDCKTVAVVTMGQQDGVFRTSVLFYPVNSTEPSAEVTLGNTTVLDLDYESGQLWVLGERALSIISDQNASLTVWPFSQYYLKGAHLGGNGFACLLLGRYRTGDADLAVTIGADGAVLGQLSSPGSILSLSARGRYIALLHGGTLNIYTQDFTAYATLDGTQNAHTVALIEDGSALLADSQTAWLYLPE